MIRLTQKFEFSASHRLHSPNLSDEENRKRFGKCNNPQGHGHNYELEVTVRGEVPADTGMVIDLKQLSDIIEREIVEKVDHKHLNFDVDFLKGFVPTAENIARAFWQILEPKITGGKLYSVKLVESENNFVEYRGE
jgi:6-pyruvoyltetrahydropterin/6-carboxytetrahydropterin synthase